MRIDLFTSPSCSACPAARDVVQAFAARHAGVEVHEWDLTRDPGPAAGRGIFVTPSVLLNGRDVLVGVPSDGALEECVERSAEAGADPAFQPVLVLNAYGDFLRRPVFEALARAGYAPHPVADVEAGVRALRESAFAGAVVALNPVLDLDGLVVQSGLGLWARVVERVGDPLLRRRPIVVTATSRASVPLVHAECVRHAIANPILILTKADATDPSAPARIESHFRGVAQPLASRA
ncbi:MAG: thioredoxin family protein [Vicinamibacteria bacterium]